MTEIKNGLYAQIPDKPDALVYTQQIQEFHLPLVSGGILDQPHIFMKEYKVCVDLISLFARQQEQSQKKGS